MTTIRFTTAWASEVAGPSLAGEAERLQHAVLDDGMGISEALTRAWMLGVRDAAVEYTAQLVSAGSQVQLHMDFLELPGDDGPDAA